MKIKKLEMTGFKSFVDRTMIHFDHDVLGIVGPNGCGKSNIVDAIRWCMGEQSAKHLRGRSMEDVLFGGSESRAASDMAEVTLTFENDDPTGVPLEFAEYSEIAVTRRLYRSGDSEYLINKVQVRLKDITDLFLGTGVGTKAYSIVEQGKIGLIVSAKPEDRRLLIEEAAGITKYKARKKAAERKMELCGQNLLRVGDIVAEIERNLGSLKRQAQKAERYISYRKELEDLQLHEASHRYLELVGWTKLHGEQVGERGTEAERARTDLASRDAEFEAARQEAFSIEEEVEGAQTRAFSAENEVRAEESAIARGKDKIESLRARETQAENEAREIDSQHDALVRERTTFEAEVQELERDEELKRAQNETEEARLAEATSELGAAEARARENQESAASAQAAIASAEATLAGHDRRAGEMTARLEKVKLEREALDGALAEHQGKQRGLEASIEAIREGKVASAEDRDRAEKRLAELREAIVGSEKALEDARAELSRVRSRHQALSDVHARLEGASDGTRALVATGDPALLGLVGDGIEAPAELTHALAGLLGDRLEDVVVSDMDRGAELLEELAKNAGGRAAIVPARPTFVAGASPTLPDAEGIVCRLADSLRFAPEDEALVRALVGDAIVVRDAEVARRVRATDPSVTLVTVSGTVTFPDGRVVGGSGDEAAAGRLDEKREIRELSERVAELDSIASERLATHQMLRGEIAETQATLEQARAKAHQGELALVTAERDLKAATSAIQVVEQRISALDNEATELARWIDEGRVERQNAEAILDGERARLETAQHALEAAHAECATHREQVEARRALVTEAKVRLAGVREKLTAARGTVARLERSAAELADRKRRLVEEGYEAARAWGETAGQIARHKETLSTALDEMRAAQDALAETRARYEAVKTDLGEREAKLKELRAETETLREALGEAERALHTRTMALEHLLESVAEKFRGLQLQRVVGDYHLRPPPDDEHRGRITELGGLIDRMGSVNLDAMREHQEAEERFTFYTTQKADLEKELADLEKAIAQMNRESRKLFAETFEAVNARFQEIFPKMFRGGRASLRLTNPEDMLETGIDILAQPPGKKLSSIELMSGGEKALTAVSLIFAIFQIKPSPFCILDEVDAPLDEANVARYNEMIRSMTDKSQFILITHIKRTMQLVDVLYGVTMQESGVSRLVSVNMSSAMDALKPAAKAKDPSAASDDAARVA
ncbi:MAG TPA: chromosome segregation protein SMC [Polyangiaceae bacterium]